MAYNAKILADTRSPVGCRLTTMMVTYPLFVHAEFLRHRVFSHSVASNRAVPTQKIIDKVKEDPFLPIYWGKNQAGMVAQEELDPAAKQRALDAIEVHRRASIELAETLKDIGLHKQSASRYLIPYQWVTDIVTGTEWANFFKLRCHPDAQPEIRKIAEMMKALFDSNTPVQRPVGSWHIPMVEDQSDLLRAGCSYDDLRRVAAGRIARISYERHDGERRYQEDIDLSFKLQDSAHWSPFEHVAKVTGHKNFDRNFRGFKQFRAFIDGETL